MQCDYSKMPSFLMYSIIGVIPLSSLMTIVHEVGHYVAIKTLFKDPKPIITLNSYGFLGGRVDSVRKKSTPFGKYFGKRKSNFLVSSAGPFCELVGSMALYHYGLPKSFSSKISLALVTENVAIAMYALGILFSSKQLNDPKNDYAKILKRSGPLAYTLFATTILLPTALMLHKQFMEVFSYLDEICYQD